jgi:hypothetical protein
MNARATLSNGKAVIENGGGKLCIHFFGPSHFFWAFIYVLQNEVHQEEWYSVNNLKL